MTSALTPVWRHAHTRPRLPSDSGTFPLDQVGLEARRHGEACSFPSCSITLPQRSRRLSKPERSMPTHALCRTTWPRDGFPTENGVWRRDLLF